MECEVLESVKVSDSSVTSCGDGLEKLGSGVEEGENLGENLLEVLDSYWEDIKDRLIISRMVSDSVIKGMVNAVEQEAAEKIAAKEIELAGLKETLQFGNVGINEIVAPRLPAIHHEPETICHGQQSSCLNAFVEHDKMRETLSSLRNAATEQFKNLKKEIDGVRGCSSIRRIGSGSELIGLGGILQEKASESWVGVDRTLDALKMSVDTICLQVDDMLRTSKKSLCERHQEQEFRGELEAMVVQSAIRSLQEEFEEKLWDHNACFCGNQSVNWLEKFNEISDLRKELDAILKLLSNPDTGQLIFHGSHDMDHFHRKALNNHVSSSSSLCEGNGKLEESETGVHENFDAAQLKHMSNKDLANYFKNIITNMRRDHESTVQQMTEEYYSLKREFLRERGSSLPLKKDKEFDNIRKKIQEAILKLDDILVENDRVPAFRSDVESLDTLKDRLDSLLSENRKLRDSLTDKENEVKCLSSQVSDAAEKMSQHSLAKTKLLKRIGELNLAMEDSRIEASISEEVYKCVLRKLHDQVKCDTEESEMEFTIMKELYGIIFREAAYDAETSSKCEVEDSDVESLITQRLNGIIFGEIIKEAKTKLKDLYAAYSVENENRVSFEKKVSEIENELRLEVEKKESLKQKVLLLEKSLEENEKLAMEASAALLKERNRASQQQTLISESSKELDIVNIKLMEALEQTKIDEVKINKLNEKLELTMEELKEADEQIKKLLAVVQEKENDLLLVEAKEKEHRKEIEAISVLVHGLSDKLADFKLRVAEDIKTNSLRLEHSSSQLKSLVKKANMHRRTGLLYKQRLERRCSDLQMAEAEVDLLGDEVDALLSLLEKIYISLDHYSPILQHYPGITEILKLVRRELSVESDNPFD